MNDDVYKVYVTTRKKNGVITKSDSFIVRSETIEEAKNYAVLFAKQYGFKGKIHIGRIFKREADNTYSKQN